MAGRDFNFHLGDNANHVFNNTTYIGMAADIPLVLSNASSTPKLIVHTSAVETYATWQAHTVHLDGYLLGYIRDSSGQSAERHEFTIPAVMVDGTKRRLVVRVVGNGPGLEDDFVLKRVEPENLDLSFGWV